MRSREERSFLPDQLQFTEAQKEQFITFDKNHRNKMIDLDDIILNQKDVLFNSFQKKDFNIDSLTTKIGLLEAKKESEVFEFFKRVRTICTPEQAEKIDAILKEAIKGRSREARPGQQQKQRMPPRRGEGMPPPR